MKTKEECLAFISQTRDKVDKHPWYIRVDDPDELVAHEDMLGILDDFQLPPPTGLEDECFGLPEGWLPDEDPETSEIYNEVFEKYMKLYDFIRFQFSREDETYMFEAAQDERDMHREYYRLVGWPFKN